MKFLPTSTHGEWRCAPGDERTFEIIAAEPSPQILGRILPQIDVLVNQATRYLSAFAKGSDWYLESLDVSAGLALDFTLEDDLYGDWRVTFEERTGGFEPVAFSRRQI